MLGRFSDYQYPLLKYLKKTFKNGYNIVCIHTLPWSTVYKIKKKKKNYILKIARCMPPKSGLHTEYKSFSLLTRHRIYNIPKCHDFVCASGIDFLLTDYIERIKDSFSYRRLGETLGKIHARIKLPRQYDCIEFAKERVGFIKDYSTKYIKFDSQLNRILKDRLHDLKKYAQGFVGLGEISYSYLNMDLSYNVVYDKNKKLYIFDWEEAGYGDRAWDLACLFNQLLRFKNQRKFFLKGYLSVIEDNPDFLLKRVDLYLRIKKRESSIYKIILPLLSKLSNSRRKVFHSTL